MFAFTRDIVVSLLRKIESVANEQKNGKPICVFILPSKNQETYAAIKTVGDMIVGITTVCAQKDKMNGEINDQNRRRNWEMLLSNIALKINLKLGGDVHHVQRNELSHLAVGNGKQLNTIVLGADVTHAPKGSEDGCLRSLVWSGHWVGTLSSTLVP
jgi:hypothetical protein